MSSPMYKLKCNQVDGCMLYTDTLNQASSAFFLTHFAVSSITPPKFNIDTPRIAIFLEELPFSKSNF